MKITLTQDSQIEVGNEAGIRDYGGVAGETIDVPADVAAMFLAGGAMPVESERAVRPKGEKATRK